MSIQSQVDHARLHMQSGIWVRLTLSKGDWLGEGPPPSLSAGENLTPGVLVLRCRVLETLCDKGAIPECSLDMPPSSDIPEGRGGLIDGHRRVARGV